MFQRHENFALRLVKEVLKNTTGLQADPDNQRKILALAPEAQWFSLELTPFAAAPQAADAKQYFSAVQTVAQLLHAYARAKQARPFEQDIPHAGDHVSDYAAEFLNKIIKRASKINDKDARRIATFVSNLDLYTAVKAVESLLNNQADLALLSIAETRGWTLHFDHLAIRCGCSEHKDAQRVVKNLRRHHGYAASQINAENYYRFEDGWEAYVLYKVLKNGQQLRLFIDQSTAGYNAQIIQHWNHVYGYTAHHLALRATRFINGKRNAVPLTELTAALVSNNVEVLTATGQYTAGLLEQVFTRPELNSDIPERIRKRLRQYDISLEAGIENGKLLELVSRREMPDTLKPDYFALYDIAFDNDNPLHSAPVYPYFLPAQAAYVIRTSVQVQ